MYLIASAHMQGASQHDNAVASAKLIEAFSKSYKVEQCVGVYNGEREMSLKIMGFESKADAIEVGQAIIAQFGQECVMLVDDKNAAYGITSRAFARIGEALRFTSQPKEASGYTQFLDGTYMVAGNRFSDDCFALAA